MHLFMQGLKGGGDLAAGAPAEADAEVTREVPEPGAEGGQTVLLAGPGRAAPGINAASPPRT